jgi:hypothetical protein
MRVVAVPLVLGLLLSPARSGAQVRPGDPPPPPGAGSGVADWSTTEDRRYLAPWHVVFADGEAELTRDGATERLAAGVPIFTGDRLRSVNGRVELRTEYHALFVDADSLVDFPADGLVRVQAGRLRALVVAPGGVSVFDGQPLRIVTPTATVRLTEVGDVGLAVSVGTQGEETLVTARLGRTDLTLERERVVVEEGDSVLARAFGRPVRVDGVDRRADFDLWVDARVGAGRPTESARYLPGSLAVYSSTLDQYGSWGVEPEYGNVWYPTVEVGWRPYSVGGWGYAGYYGWVWSGGGPWGWPTHHYGRWGWRNNRWFWAPGPVWGPAYVAWGVSSGYVSWCPLGWNNGPVFSLSVYAGGGYGYYGGFGYRGARYPWHGWTVMPSRHFRRGVAVPRYALSAQYAGRLDGRSFNVSRRAPSARGEYRGEGLRGGESRPGAFAGGESRPGSIANGGRGLTRGRDVAAVDGGDRGGARAVPRDGARTSARQTPGLEGAAPSAPSYRSRVEGAAPAVPSSVTRGEGRGPSAVNPGDGVRSRSALPRADTREPYSTPYRSPGRGAPSYQPRSAGPGDTTPAARSYGPRVEGAAPRPQGEPRYQAPQRSAPSYQSRPDRSYSAPRGGGDSGGTRSYTPRGGGDGGSRSAPRSGSAGSQGGGRRAAPRR